MLLALTFSHSVSAPPTHSGNGLWALGEACTTCQRASKCSCKCTPCHKQIPTANAPRDGAQSNHTVCPSVGVTTTPGVHQCCNQFATLSAGHRPPSACFIETSYIIVSPSLGCRQPACTPHLASAAAAAASAPLQVYLCRPAVPLQPCICRASIRLTSLRLYRGVHLTCPEVTCQVSANRHWSPHVSSMAGASREMRSLPLAVEYDVVV
jgi:hypothetical protein